MSAPLKSIEGTGDMAVAMGEIGRSARAAARLLALASEAQKNRALDVMAAAIRAQKARILAANTEDLSEARAAGVAGSFLDRLVLDEARVEAIAAGIELVRALNTYLVLLADHGMNASTFTARVIASTDSDLASCLVGAIGALKGPAHGGAPSAVMDQLEKIGTADNADHWLREARKEKVRFMGFGHRVYRTYDPRARILKALCQQLNPKFYELASKVEETALEILHEEHPERPQATNVEFYSAGVLQAIGLPTEFFPPTFAVARVAGWSAHVLEQGSHNRLIRPQSEYIGPEPRKPVPLAER